MKDSQDDSGNIIRPHPPDDIINNIPDTRTAPSSVHGYGLFLTGPVKKGKVLGLLDGQKISWDLYYSRETVASEWNALEDGLVIRSV